MESQELKIVKVRPEDNHTLLEIGRQTFYDAFGSPHNTEENIHYYLSQKFTLEKITNEILNPESQFFFALYKDKIVGYLKLNSGSAQTEFIKGNSIEIERIYVINIYQGKGIGKYLLDNVIRIAKEKTVAFIWLGVWEKNKSAINFYQQNGFKIFDKHRFMLGSDKQTDIMMRLDF
ncbi:GNAT family N-acetyltransferase [Aquimarina sp. 2201CG14-23]|uniref:GNAT family N-acetyltransferase n=1 Tax=Aquimarina mycalae TaxID=3040073 RepID=UPI002477D389|nr:GNAT family N-acetyltransferase [Aquimarina sp. 2201CG14-23]MDH7446520.1 GNAT family N-acetyltransferase [Aquimarina sp. 2201CG14-23]